MSLLEQILYAGTAMAIWKTKMTIEELSNIRKETMDSTIGIEFLEVGENFLTGRMPVNEKTIQLYGIMHGGASCTLAETLGSLAGAYCIDMSKQAVVGTSIYTNHLRMAKSGFVYGKATPIHLGKTTQVWEIHITNEEQKLVSVTRLSLAIIDREQL